jgi:hypothetical protein
MTIRQTRSLAIWLAAVMLLLALIGYSSVVSIRVSPSAQYRTVGHGW